jgi:hypothetical protein
MKKVIEIPLKNLWKDSEELPFIRGKYLNSDEIREILKLSAIIFVIADIGTDLKWIEINVCYVFWKEEVKKHLIENRDEIILGDFPDNYAYLASKYENAVGDFVILLEKIH